ncbi:MAG: glycosyltransferase family 9 protein [Bacteroidota bacterium]
MNFERIVISRTDSIGDVMLTLPMLVWLKKNYPQSELIYLGSGYTRPVVDCFSVVDRFIDWKELEMLPTAERVSRFSELRADAIIHVFPVKEIASLAKKAKIPFRVGTSHRTFHLLTCNHRISFTRKRSDLHESQLNFELLRPFGLREIPTLNAVREMLDAFVPTQTALPAEIAARVQNSRENVVLHPKSQGSALEWTIENYVELAKRLAEKGAQVFFTGTENEGKEFRHLIPDHALIMDTTGQMTLTELITFIGKCNALVACSTGPLHIAAFTGIRTVGLFSPRKPIHPGRWAALGRDVEILVYDESCPICKKGKTCKCITQITVDSVYRTIT